MKEIGEFKAFYRGIMETAPPRPPKGELLARAREIPLVWPESEFPANRSLPDQFKSVLGMWGGHVHRTSNRAESLAKLTELLTQCSAKRAARWSTPRLDALDLGAALAPLDLAWADTTPLPPDATATDRRDRLKDLAAIDAGIIDCEFAIAHTGTLVLRHGPGRDGLTNILPWTLIAIVETNQLVRDVQDGIERLGREQQGQPWPAHTVLLSGPSRSGDIDLHAGQGAAGPGKHHVILADTLAE